MTRETYTKTKQQWFERIRGQHTLGVEYGLCPNREDSKNAKSPLLKRVILARYSRVQLSFDTFVSTSFWHVGLKTNWQVLHFPVVSGQSSTFLERSFCCCARSAQFSKDFGV